MTDNELARIRRICEVAHIKDIGDLSDGFHTFNDLYHQRCMLFAAIVKQNKGNAWKSHNHEDGEPCFGGGWFIVGVDTPEGSYTFHYEDKYWDLFDCEVLTTGKHWDGHTDKDVTRLLSLPTVPMDTEKIINYAEEKLSHLHPDEKEKDHIGMMVETGWLKEVIKQLKT